MNSFPPQQMKVAGLVARGLMNKQIAFELGLAEGTIKAHVSSVIRRIGAARGNGGRVRIALWYLGQCDPSERDAIIAGRRA